MSSTVTLVLQILGGLALFAVAWGYLSVQFRHGRTDRQRELSETDSKLIGSLKETIDVMEEKITELKTEQDFHKTEIRRLTAENTVMTKVFQGRDEQTQVFQTEGLKAIALSAELYKVTMTTSKNVERLAIAIEKHLATIDGKRTPSALEPS